MRELVSVIIPVYNSEKYIYDCILSVQEQSFSNLEILIVDDGSEDESMEICRKLNEMDQRIHTLSQNHKGVSSARNKGIGEAKGKYLFFLDSDDMIHPELIGTLYKLLEENDAVIATEYYCQKKEDLYKSIEQMIDEGSFSEKAQISIKNLSKENTLGYTYLENQKMLWEFLMHGTQGGIGGKMIRHAALQDLKFDERLSTGEDTKLIYQLICHDADAIILHQNWYYYRSHEDNASKKYSVKVYQGIYESIKYICDNERINGRITNSVRCEEYIIKCILNWKCINKKTHNSEIKQYLKMLMHTEKKSEIFSMVTKYYKINFYLMLYSYPVYFLKSKIRLIWDSWRAKCKEYCKKNRIWKESKDAVNCEPTAEDEKRGHETEDKISVIIYMHGSQNYIRRCIQTVVNQTYLNLEIIVIRDREAEWGVEISEELEKLDDRICVFTSRSKGISAARNRGVEIATGKYVFFLDGNDAIHPLLLEELIYQVKEYHVNLVICEYEELYATWMEKVLDRLSEEDERPQWKILEETDVKQWFNIKFKDSLMCVGMLIHREFIGKLQFDENLIYGQDALFIYYLICKQICIAYSNEAWYYHRRYSGDIDYFIKNKNDYYIYRILRDEELLRDNTKFALIWERRLIWLLRQEFTSMKEKGENQKCEILKEWAFMEKKQLLFKKLAMSAKVLFICCFYCWPLYHILKKPVTILDKFIWSIKGEDTISN